LHEELRQLPEKYRTPLILCYLEGKTQDEAARQLGWPSRRVKDRLQRGREQLRRRLQNRGLAPAAVLGTALFAAEGASAAVPATLAGATVRAAISGTASPAVAALVEAGGAFVSAGKAKMAMVILLAVSLLSGAGVYFLASPQRQQGQPLPVLRTGRESPDAPRSSKRDESKEMEIQGRVLDPEGKPKAGAKLLLLDRKGNVKQLGVAAADGRFAVTVAKEITRRWHHWLVVREDGSALDFLSLYQWKGEKPVELRLVKDHPIRGRLVNTEGKPIRGVRVVVAHIDDPSNTSLDSFLVARKKLTFGSSIGCKKSLGTEGNSPLATTTDAEGRFVIHGAGVERLVSLHLSGPGIADEERSIVNRAGFDPEPYNQAARDKIPKGEKPYGSWFLHGPNVSVVAEAEKLIHGVVTDADTGNPVPGVRVGRFNHAAKTDAEGRYQIHGVHKAESYTIEIASDPSTGYMASQVHAADTTGYQPIRADIRIKKGVITSGKVIDEVTGKSVPGYAAAAILEDNPFVKKYPQLSSYSMFGDREYTEGDGAFRIVTIPGRVLLMVGFDHSQSTGSYAEEMKYADPLPDPKYPQYFHKDGDYLRFPLFGDSTPAVQGNFCKVLEIKPGTAIVHQDAVLRRAHGLPVKIEDAEGRPVRGAWATGMIGLFGHPPVQIHEASC
jgi:hypothetical protein